MQIEFSESAVLDIEDIKYYYLEQQVPHIGDKFISDIIDHLETLASNPKIGRIVPEFQVPHIRELIHSPFRVVYMFILSCLIRLTLVKFASIRSTKHLNQLMVECS